jgi:hypothetical protein
MRRSSFDIGKLAFVAQFETLNRLLCLVKLRFKLTLTLKLFRLPLAQVITFTH